MTGTNASVSANHKKPPAGTVNRRPSLVAAEAVLRAADGEALHYRDIAARAQAAGFGLGGLTPWFTLNRDVRDHILRAETAGRVPRFVRVGRGHIALAPDMDDLCGRAARIRREVRRGLRRQLLRLHPQAFDELIAELLGRMGFNDVLTTRATPVTEASTSGRPGSVTAF